MARRTRAVPMGIPRTERVSLMVDRSFFKKFDEGRRQKEKELGVNKLSNTQFSKMLAQGKGRKINL